MCVCVCKKYACMSLYVCMCAYESLCACVSLQMCACVCVSVHVYICGMPNIKFVSFGIHACHIKCKI